MLGVLQSEVHISTHF